MDNRDGKVPKHKLAVTNTKRIVFSGVMAALYVVLTLPFAQFAYGPVQFRLAEVLTVLPCFTPFAIPGITIGCFLANLFNPSALGPVDIIFGSLATLAAGVLSYLIGRKNVWLGLIPPVIVNGVVVGTYLVFLIPGSEISAVAILISILSVAGSEAVLLAAIGVPFVVLIKKTKMQDYLRKM